MLIRALTYRDQGLAVAVEKALSGGTEGVIHMTTDSCGKDHGAVMASAEVEIVNKLGLHARASAKLTQVASGYPCEVWLSRNGRRVNAKSIMGVMMLAAGKGAMITIEARGRRRRRGARRAAETDRGQVRRGGVG